MAKRAIPRVKARLYIQEHIDADPKKNSDTELGKRLGKNRATAFKWRTDPYRLDSQQLSQLADALGLDDMLDLYSPPGAPSIDAKMREAGTDLRRNVAAIVDNILKVGT